MEHDDGLVESPDALPRRPGDEYLHDRKGHLRVLRREMVDDPEQYHPVIVNRRYGPPDLISDFFDSWHGQEKFNCFIHPDNLLARLNWLVETTRREASALLGWNWDNLDSPAMPIDSFRSYQECGCIDTPTAGYQLRHLLQAASICKLRLECVPEMYFLTLLVGRSDNEYRHLLRNDVRMKRNRNPRCLDSRTRQYSQDRWLHNHGILGHKAGRGQGRSSGALYPDFLIHYR